ncbi:hypothetical protein C2E23DRAFT_887786 [Lenzites betulinus]|nr:hypothetical protein C2E23DRAFT_887786 [Lenzites betulinus]
MSRTRKQGLGPAHAAQDRVLRRDELLCRQLGIVAYKTPLPLAFADPDSGEVLMPDMDATPANEEDGEFPLESPAVPRAGAGIPSGPGEKAAEKAAWLGFRPPPEDGFPSGLKRRKPRSKKAIMQSFGMDF